MSPQTSKKIHLALGPGNRLYSEDNYLEAVEPLGMTRRGFRRWMKALQVPFMEIGKIRFYDNLSLSMALRHVMRVGADDFFAPTSDTVARGRAKASELDLTGFLRNQSSVITELLYAQSHARTIRPAQVRKAAVAAAHRMAAVGLAEAARLDPSLMDAYNQLRETVYDQPIDPD